jgi:hypothetical protein
VMSKDGWRNRHSSESGDAGGSWAVRGGPFEERNVLSIDSKCAGCVGGGDRAVVEVIVAEDALKIGLRRAAKESVKVTSFVGVLDLTWRE